MIEMKKAEVSQWALQAQAALETQPKDALSYLRKAFNQAQADLGSQLADNTQDSMRNTLSHVSHRSKLGPYADQVNEVVFAPKNWGRALRQATDPDSTHPILVLGRRDGRSSYGIWAITTTPTTTCSLSLRSVRPEFRLVIPRTGSIGSCSSQEKMRISWRSPPVIPQV